MRPSQSLGVPPLARPLQNRARRQHVSPLPRWERVRVRVIGVDKGEGHGKTALTQSSNTTAKLRHSGESRNPEGPGKGASRFDLAEKEEKLV